MDACLLCSLKGETWSLNEHISAFNKPLVENGSIIQFADVRVKDEQTQWGSAFPNQAKVNACKTKCIK